jgi:signal transduction histidine kinase
MIFSGGERDELLATLAHELRNPLGSLMNSLELMKLAPGNVVLVGRARATMERQLTQMKRLVEDALDFSRAGREVLDLRKTSLDLGAILGEAVETNRATPAASERTVTFTVPAEPLWIEADAGRLTQIFGNLLTNACKYTDRGGHIAVAIQRQGSDVLVSVADDGIGIRRSLLEAVFERFMQVDGSGERARGGLGIGLALARHLVELHEGTISARSEGLGCGSEFIVRLPMPVDRVVVTVIRRRRIASL